MADTFLPLAGQSDPNSCPQGQAFSAILQKCLSASGYDQAIAALVQIGKPQDAFNLQQEAIQNGIVSETNPVNALLSGNWSGLARLTLPIGIGLIGLILVFLAISAWVNAKSVTVAGQTVSLPKVL